MCTEGVYQLQVMYMYTSVNAHISELIPKYAIKIDDLMANVGHSQMLTLPTLITITPNYK